MPNLDWKPVTNVDLIIHPATLLDATEMLNQLVRFSEKNTVSMLSPYVEGFLVSSLSS
jgi:hypothetical protein